MPCRLMSCECGKHYFAQRYLICIMSLLAITLCYNQRVNLNLAITSMVKPIEKNLSRPGYCPADPVSNKTIEGDAREWDTVIQGYTKLSFYIGYVVLHIPGGIMSDLLGGRITVLTASIVSTIGTFLTPGSVFIGDWWLLCITRIVMGGAQGILFPAVSSLLAQWVPKKERSFLGAFAFSGSHVGSITGSVFTGLVIDLTHSWPMGFYFWGFVMVPFIVATLFWVFSTPKSHPFITEDESNYLAEVIPVKTSKSIPWRDICGDVHVWAIVIGEVAHAWMFFTLSTDLPNYLKNIQGFDIKSNGVLSAMPFLGMFITSLIAGKIADVLIERGVRVVTVRRWATFIGNVLASATLLVVPLFGCQRTPVVAILIISMIVKAPYYVGVRLNHLDLSVHFPGILHAFVNGLGSVSAIITPYVIGQVAKDQTMGQWQLVFIINFGVSSVPTIISMIFTSGDRAEWDMKYDEVQL